MHVPSIDELPESLQFWYGFANLQSREPVTARNFLSSIRNSNIVIFPLEINGHGMRPNFRRQKLNNNFDRGDWLLDSVISGACYVSFLIVQLKLNFCAQDVRFGLRLLIILENPILEGTARKLLFIGMVDHKNNNPVDLASVKWSRSSVWTNISR